MGADSVQEFPVLSGPGVKGANTKTLIPWLTRLTAQLNDDTSVKRRRFLMMKSLHDYMCITSSAGTFLTALERTAIKKAVHEHLINYTYLAGVAMRAGSMMYNVVSKHHYFAHLGDEVLNPRMLSTYQEESMVGTGARIFAAAAFGPCKNVVQSTVLHRWLVALQLKLSMAHWG